MKDIEFELESQIITIQGKSDDKLKNLLQTYAMKSEIDISTIYFTYNGIGINEELTLSQLIGGSSEQKIKILAYKKDDLKSIALPKCNENIKYGPEESGNRLCPNFNIFFETLEKMKDNTQNINNCEYYKILASMLLNEFKKYDDIKYRELILEKIIGKNDLIKYSSLLISFIIENA